jgi:predicted metal-dependent peptidase
MIGILSSTPKNDAARWLYAAVQADSFLEQYPAYAAVLARVIPVHDASVTAMAVSTRGGELFLHVNARWVQANPRHVRGVLLHEVHHLVLGHVTHPKFRGLAHNDLLMIAMEISANEHIVEALPDPIVLDDYRAIGIAPGQSTLERYRLLVQARTSGTLPAMPSDPCRDLASLQQTLRDPCGDELGTSAVREILETIAARREGMWRASLAGKQAGALAEEITISERDASIDWRAALRMFVEHRRSREWSYARPNRRFPDRVGEVPARMRLARKTEKPRVLVAIDTSASISTATLGEVARELERASEHVEIVVAECDAAIQRVYEFEGTLRRAHGRGGTDLRPPFANRVLVRHRVKGVVYFTDGQGPYPDEAPRVPVLWVLSAGGFGCPWGARVRM